jgi:hypothetical protein
MQAAVLRLDGEGYSYREIAKKLGPSGPSKNTVGRLIKQAQVEKSQLESLGQQNDPSDKLIHKGSLPHQPGPEERPITGAQGYTVREDGIVKQHGKRVEPEEIGLWRANKHKNGHKFRTRSQLAIFIPNYHGLVPSIGRTRDTTWWAPESVPVDRDCLLRPLDEIVAYEFLPRPHFMSSMKLLHLNGDDQNCEASNLKWLRVYSDEPGDFLKSQGITMSPPDRTGTVYRRRFEGPPTKPYRELNFVESNNVPGNLPTFPERSNHVPHSA